MANYVSTIISVQSDEGKVGKKLQEVFDKDLQTDEAFYKAIYESDTLQNGEPYSTGYGQYLQDIGSKWCYMTDSVLYDNNAELSLESAWSFPEGAFKQIYNLLAKLDPNVLIYCSYTDEAYNFVGAAAYGPSGYHNLEESDLPEYPNMDEMSDDEAMEQWQEEVDEIIFNLKETTKVSATKKKKITKTKATKTKAKSKK